MKLAVAREVTITEKTPRKKLYEICNDLMDNVKYFEEENQKLFYANLHLTNSLKFILSNYAPRFTPMPTEDTEDEELTVPKEEKEDLTGYI